MSCLRRHVTPAVMATLASLAAAGLLGAPAPNLVVNPGFETAAPNDTQPLAWAVPSRPGVRFAWDRGVAHGGDASGRVDGLDPARQTRYVQAWRQDVEIPPERPLEFSVWVKAENLDSGRLNLLHRSRDGEVLKNQGIASFSGTFDWQQFGGEVRPASGTVSLQLVMGLVKSTGSVWFDDVVLAPHRNADDPGKVRMRPPAPQTAAATVPTHFDITLGASPLAPGGRVLLRWDNWRPAREFRLTDFRAAAPGCPGTFAVRIPPRKKSWPPEPKPIAVELTWQGQAALPAAAAISVDAKLRYTPSSNVTVGLTAMAAAEPGALPRPLAAPLRLSAHGGPPAVLRCVAEARPWKHHPGRVVIAVVDRFGNPVESFRGALRFAPLAGATLPDSYRFTEADAGSHDFSVTVAPERISRIEVGTEALQARSNPIWPRPADAPGVYFGDIHSHCEISADGVGDPDLGYDYARRFYGLDLATLSDHSPRGKAWKRAVAAANRHNQPGQFVALLGFEWSHQRVGHRNAYYPGSEAPEQPAGLPNNMDAWWSYLDRHHVRALTVPHHPNTDSKALRPDGKPVWGPADWSEINHRYQRLVEICQNRGSFEVPGPNLPLRVVREDRGASVQTALAKGHRLGFIGSTDTHSGRPGTGDARCAVLSRDLTREAIWQALHDRRCYATTGAHILMEFTLNNQPMGSEITAPAEAPRKMAWRVAGTAPILRVDLLRNNEVVRSWPGDGAEDMDAEFSDDAALTETEWWYLRVIQQDTQMAWSSPVWVDAGETAAKPGE